MNYLDYIDNTVNPGDNFFKYATGHWIDFHPQLPEYPRWGTFTELGEENLKRVAKLIKNPGNSEIAQKIKTYHKIYSNWDKRNEDGVLPLKHYLYKNVYSLFTREEIIDFCAKEHYTLFFDFEISPDFKNPDMYALWEWEDGLSLGNRDYYLVKSATNKKILKAFKKHVIDAYKLIGKSDEVAKEKYKTIFKIEKQIAKVYTSIEEQQEPSKNYHKKNIEKLSKSVNFDLNRFLCIYGYDNSKEIIIGQEKPFKFACKLYNTLPIEDLKTILEWHVISSCLNLLNDDAYKILFKFSQAITGVKKGMPKKKRVINAVSSMFSETISELYAKKYFSEDAKQDAQQLINELIISFKNVLSEHTWLSDNTRKLAFDKLNKVRIKVGYPDTFDDYSDIPIDENISLFENHLNIYQYKWEKNKNKKYNKPVNKNEWHTPSYTINAYYDFTSNEICFPAGILQGDFYEYGRDAALNYGAIGVVIGHELTHGFDNHGRQFDANGNMRQWWTDEEIKKFNELTENTKNRFNELDVLPGLKANGSLTLSENIADYGGIKIAYNALQSKTESIEEARKFFISFAIVWAGVNTDEILHLMTTTNEHSANFNRVNGTLPMFTPWYEAFGISEKDKLYVPINKRAKIW